MGQSAPAVHRFIPVNAYPTRDGYVYVAIGSDAQWSRLVGQPMFAALDQERFGTNEGRRAAKVELHGLIAGITEQNASSAVVAALVAATIPHAPITPIEEVADLPFVASTALRTVAPDPRREVRLPPPAVTTAHLEKIGGRLPFAPAYGEHTDALLSEVGVPATEIATLRTAGVVA